MVLPRHWHVKLFLRPVECINYLQREPSFWEADAWNQQQLIDQWRAGKPLIPQVLDYWSRYTERYALSQVCVVDYSMPAMDGLQALGELGDWPGARVLLTGQADEQVAVRAFNGGLIDQFIAKQMPDISSSLIEAVEHLLHAPNPRHDQTWRASLSARAERTIAHSFGSAGPYGVRSQAMGRARGHRRAFRRAGNGCVRQRELAAAGDTGRPERPGGAGRTRRRGARRAGGYPGRAANSPISSCGRHWAEPKRLNSPPRSRWARTPLCWARCSRWTLPIVRTRPTATATGWRARTSATYRAEGPIRPR